MGCGSFANQAKHDKQRPGTYYRRPQRRCDCIAEEFAYCGAAVAATTSTIPSPNRASAKLRRHSLMHVQEICLLDQKLARAAAAVLISPINSGKSGKAPQCGHGQRRD